MKPHRTPYPALALTLLSSLTSVPARAQQPRPEVKPAPGAALLLAADDITRQVSALRGLPLLRPFAKGILNRQQITQKLRERIDKEYTPEEVRIESRVLKRLGLLPPDADYMKILTDLLEEQVAGFYDPFAKQLYVADWLQDELQRPAMAHEIEHALQDQHFDLKAFATPIKDDGDRQLARSALVEGDGTAVMLEFVVQSLGIDLTAMPDAFAAMAQQLTSSQVGNASPALAKAPRFLRDTLTFPYFAGMTFVMALHKKQPWSKMNAVWKDPPESTEQVLHPQKYIAHERPVTVVAAPIEALAPGKELRRDVFGELEWKLLLATQLDDAVAERAAAGWGGDRMAAWGSDGDGPVAVFNLSTWDTVEDAIELESAARHFFAKQTRQAEAAVDKPAVYEVAGEAFSVERRGKDVLTIFGVASDKRAAATDEVWKKWKVEAVATPAVGKKKGK